MVRASVPIQLAQSGLSSNHSAKFLAANPKVQVQLLVTNRRVELIEEGVDVAFRVRTTLDTDAALKMRVLGRERVLIVASPEFTALHGEPRTPQDLETLPTLGHLEAGGKDVWRLTHTDGREAVVEHTPRLAAGDFTPLLDAAVAGIGVGFLPEMVCREALQDGGRPAFSCSMNGPRFRASCTWSSPRAEVSDPPWAPSSTFWLPSCPESWPQSR